MALQDDELPIDSEERSKTVTWDVPPPPDKNPQPKAIPFTAALKQLLDIYQPAESELLSDKQFTTAEIIQALELHYNVPQGDLEGRSIEGEKVVEYLQEAGYKCVNTGALTLQWLMNIKEQTA